MKLSRTVAFHVMVTLTSSVDPSRIHRVRVQGSMEVKRRPRSQKKLLALVEGHMRVHKLLEWADLVSVTPGATDVEMFVEAV